MNVPMTIYYREKSVCPCKDCADREAGCHTRCKRYIEWTENRRAEMLKAKKAYATERALEDSVIKAKLKTIKKNRR